MEGSTKLSEHRFGKTTKCHCSDVCKILVIYAAFNRQREERAGGAIEKESRKERGQHALNERDVKTCRKREKRKERTRTER